VVHKKGGTALIEASGEGWLDVVKDLIYKKADVNVQAQILKSQFAPQFPV